MARTERESERRKELADLLVLPRLAENLKNGAGFSGKLEHTGPAKKERVAAVLESEHLAGMPEPPLIKGKGTDPSVPITKS